MPDKEPEIKSPPTHVDAPEEHRQDGGAIPPGSTMRVSFNGRTSGFQPEDGSSILPTRTKITGMGVTAARDLPKVEGRVQFPYPGPRVVGEIASRLSPKQKSGERYLHGPPYHRSRSSRGTGLSRQRKRVRVPSVVPIFRRYRSARKFGRCSPPTDVKQVMETATMGRSVTVALLTLDQPVGVQIPAPQPKIIPSEFRQLPLPALSWACHRC